MHVYYDKRHDRFFIRKNSACSWGHKYHSPVREEDRESNARELGENALKVFKSLVERHAPASLAAETAALVAGSASKLSKSSRDYLRHLVLVEKYGNTDKDESEAAKAIRLLKEAGHPHVYISQLHIT